MELRIIKCGDCKYSIVIRDEADESVANEIFKYHEYRAADAIIKNATYPIVDVGAHSGLFTLYARCLNASVPIVAIEPESRNLAILRQHLKENKIDKVLVVDAALARESGKRDLVISADSHNHYLLNKNNSAEETIRVQTYSLSDLMEREQINRIDLLKMDIEGGEYEVFESLKAGDYKKIGAIIMEYHNYSSRTYSEIENKLRENGFGVQIFPSRFDKQMGFLLAKNKRM